MKRSLTILLFMITLLAGANAQDPLVRPSEIPEDLKQEIISNYFSECFSLGILWEHYRTETLILILVALGFVIVSFSTSLWVWILGFGVLAGKYLAGQRPPGARLTLFPHYGRYSNPQAQRATRDYVTLARDHGLDPAQMALAFVTSRPFVTSNIIGATTREQLQSNLDSLRLTLSEPLLQEIEAIHQGQPNPSP